MNDRTDFALIKNGKRIFGCDNLGGWHIHPLRNPDEHESCKEPEIEDIFKKVKNIIDELGA
jgi:hypothetical protein